MDDVMEALRTIKKHCISNKTCETCTLYQIEMCVMIFDCVAYKLPDEWNLIGVVKENG